MARLIPLSEITTRHADALGNDYYDPTGSTAYGTNGERIGTVRGALAEAETGRIRSLIVDAGGWFSSKEVVVPVGMARIEGDGVYFDNLTKDQVSSMQSYVVGQDYSQDAQYADERVLRAANPAYADDAALYRTPDRLQLLEERLVVNKDRFVAGSVEVSKHVETTTQRVDVPLSREEVVIERHTVTDGRPVEGNVTLGADSQTMRVDLEAERANIGKQAFVTEEVSIGKRTVTETQTHTAEVGREVLDVNQTGDVRLEGAADTAGRVGSAAGDVAGAAGNKIEEGADRLRALGHEVAGAVTGNPKHDALAAEDRAKADMNNAQASADMSDADRKI
ncbi:PRC and DUF2382 domain-containing protein [Deinococcus wulumuqiensis]|uniref:PRC and DUF2382 domain-containing protein n=1 Tax=Deinococcus wulumuqiensis TaxID=980427 RepID=UPI003C6C2EE2